jgi:hypothetical protein
MDLAPEADLAAEAVAMDLAAEADLAALIALLSEVNSPYAGLSGL